MSATHVEPGMLVLAGRGGRKQQLDCVVECGYPRGADIGIVHTSKERKRCLSGTRERGLAVSSSSVPEMPEGKDWEQKR